MLWPPAHQAELAGGAVPQRRHCEAGTGGSLPADIDSPRGGRRRSLMGGRQKPFVCWWIDIQIVLHRRGSKYVDGLHRSLQCLLMRTKLVSKWACTPMRI